MAKAIRLAVIVTIVVFLVQLLYFYAGVYAPSTTGMHDTAITIPLQPTHTMAVPSNASHGKVVVDRAHGNPDAYETLANLLALVVEEGGRVEFATNVTKDSLQGASSFVTLLPQQPFTEKEMEQLRGFTKDGGRLLFISDPDIQSSISLMSAPFGIVYEDDYIYHPVDNDINFKNVIFEAGGHPLLRGVGKVVFYTTCSVRPANGGILIREAYVSNREEPAMVSPAVLVGNALGLCDRTFLMSPYSYVADNQVFLSNIASWLAGRPAGQANLTAQNNI